MKKILESLWFLLVGVFLVGAVYGSLTIVQTAKANNGFNQTQQVLADKIADLEVKVTGQQQTIDDLAGKLAEVKKIASAPKPVLTAPTAPAPSPAPTPEIQTVTKTVVVKEKPKPTVNVTIQGVGSYHVATKSGDTALSALKRAASQNGFTVDLTTYEGMGAFVTGISNIKPAGNQYWAFYYNGQYSMVGASAQKISDGDTTFWRLESF